MGERDAFTGVVEALHEAMLDDAWWPETSARIDAACGAKGSLLTFGEEFPQARIEFYIARCYHRGVDRSDWLRAYFEQYYAEDEHVPRLRLLPDGKIVPIGELFSDEERKTSRTYNEGLACFDTRNGVNVRLDGPGGSRIVWAIADPIDAAGWTSSRVGMITRILPHLRQYIRVRSALVDAGALGASSSALLEHVRAGVVVLDRRGRIAEMNDAARRLLLAGRGLLDSGGELRAAAPDDNARLQSLLARALPYSDGQAVSGSVVVGRSRRFPPKLALHVKPVAQREVQWRARQIAALVLIVDPIEQARIDARVVEEMLGLTPVEAKIAVLLAEGRVPREIAAATGRGYSTVRSHLRHMYTKLGVSRQFEVAQLVLALSRMPGAGE